MQKILKIKESPKGIYVIASLFVLNGLINLPRSLDSILFFVVGLILCAVFVIWALGIMRHNIYAWAGAVIVSAMGAVSFSYYLILALVLVNGIPDSGLVLGAYFVLAAGSISVFVYLISAKIRKLFGPFPFT